MPINLFQSKLMKLLASNRNPDSYLAGGVAINHSAKSKRYSKDIDIFHHLDESVQTAFKQDRQVLIESGYTVDVIQHFPTFVRAFVNKGKEGIKIEWVRDSAFRFFPIIEDKVFGYRLHDIDLATNKCLALAGRQQIRDLIDIIQIHETTLCLAAMCWAACAKDPGFNPESLLNYMNRNARIDPLQLEQEELTVHIDPVQLKTRWLDLVPEAINLIHQLPAEDIGCLYLENGKPIKCPIPDKLKNYTRHFGSVGGSWPRTAV